MKIGKNQVLLPSGVVASKDGKYHYWACTVSGLATFAKPDYWVKVMAKFKTEENLVKTYVCKKAKAYLDAGFDAAQIRELAKGGELAPLGGKKIKIEKPKRVKKKSLKSFAVATVKVEKQNDTGSIDLVKVPVYPWQGNPDYFRSIPTPFSVETESQFACIYPNHNLDSECRNCPIYDRCNCTAKLTEKDWKKGVKRNEVKITQIASFGD